MVDSGAIATRKLVQLAATAKDCKACRLHETRTNTVFESGSHAAELMFIGEGPGATEDKEGIPFVGASGDLLNRMLASIQFVRNDVYVCNVVKCRPPGNRTPRVDEVKACRGYLEQQVELVRPKVIVTLGATAMKALLGKAAKMTEQRGKWHEYLGIDVMTTFHPAYLLRERKERPEDLKAHREVWEDMRAVAAKLGRTITGPIDIGAK
jgi:DNA polymerase